MIKESLGGYHNASTYDKKNMCVYGLQTIPNFLPGPETFMVVSLEIYSNTQFLPSNVVFLCPRDHYFDKNELNSIEHQFSYKKLNFRPTNPNFFSR